MILEILEEFPKKSLALRAWGCWISRGVGLSTWDSSVYNEEISYFLPNWIGYHVYKDKDLIIEMKQKLN